ncbi:UxaA family hydrolase [Vibrio sp. CAU 1672]|uniref:UxaA family hydrolase n=1 Tax=Vibrio sp. CAU 1672 TaxID=3032594 RepID=UPI0023DACADC|nr:UxaA family hydrolase [Vibrio sp. CAU 1672]MDF2152295.1 UxaA family hydrolase [Vibrio sp. CAU 1672]
MSKLKKALRLSPNDNVATVLSDIARGEQIEIIDTHSERIAIHTAHQAIPFGNKVALDGFEAQTTVTKGGYPIGLTCMPIKSGDLVHVQNVRSTRVDIPTPIIEQIIQQMQIECEV